MPHHFKAPRRSVEEDKPSRAEVGRAKDFWSDLFVDAILAQIDESSVGRKAPEDIVRYARKIADFALEEMEERWQKL